ncbi:MAG: response regulator [Bdellovibrionaceae bacterium]|nr:response regulator [Pseudobdellovibrionaceae bacterium]
MKILIVDDEVLVRRSLERVVRKQGHEVWEAADGVDGLSKWREHDPDLVFLDVLMPGLTGPQVLEEIGPSRRAKVILMSAYLGQEKISEGSVLAVDMFLPKPFEDVFEIVRRAEELLS